MKKVVLDSFIKRYSLGGQCEESHWYSDPVQKTLCARAHTQTKTVIIKVVLKEWDLPETFQIAIRSSVKVQKMLSPIGDDINISLTTIRDKVSSIIISDNDCEAVCTVSEYDAFPETVDADSAEIPKDFDLEITLNDEFVSKFMKAITALSEAKDFVLMNNKKGALDLVINYEDTNTNRIRIPVPTINGKDKIDTIMGFSSEVLKAILTANQPLILPKNQSNNTEEEDSDKNEVPKNTPPILKVANSGIAIIQFDEELFKTTYFLFPTRIVE